MVGLTTGTALVTSPASPFSEICAPPLIFLAPCAGTRRAAGTTARGLRAMRAGGPGRAVYRRQSGVAVRAGSAGRRSLVLFCGGFGAGAGFQALRARDRAAAAAAMARPCGHICMRSKLVVSI